MPISTLLGLPMSFLSAPRSRSIDLRARQLRRLWTFIAMLCVGAGAFAQTAHYEGTDTGLNVTVGTVLGVAMDPSGNVFVVDQGNGAIKEILAGTGGAMPGKISAFPTVVTVASGFGSPYGVALDASGDVYFTDTSNNTVNEIEAVGGVVPPSPTVVTLGSSFNLPFGVAVDPSGDVFVADTYNNALKEFVAGTGGAPAGQVSPTSTLLTLTNVTFSPGGVAVDRSGNVFLSDRNSGSVWEIAAGTGGASAGQVSSSSTITKVATGFTSPIGVALDASGDLFVADAGPSANWVTEIVAISGQVSLSSPVIIRDGNSGPFGIGVNAVGDIYASYPGYPLVAKFEPAATDFGIVNLGNTSIREYVPFKFDSAGTPSGWSVETLGAQGMDYSEVTTGGGIVTSCSTTAAYSAGDVCIVAVEFSPTRPGQRLGAVQMFDSTGNLIATANLTGVGSAPQVVFPSNNTPMAVGSSFNGPTSTAVDASGDVFVADTTNSAVKEIVATGGQVSSASTVNSVGSGFNFPRGVAVDGSGNVFVADTGHNSIKEIVAVNGVISSASQVRTVATGFSNPYGVAVDARGNVFVADTFNFAIDEVVAVDGQASTSSPVITLATISLAYPCGIAVDASGDVFFTDTNFKAVKEIVAVNGQVSPSSSIITVGSGFSYTYGVTADASGDVFVADNGHNEVEEIVAVNGQVSSTSEVVTLGSGFNAPNGVAVDAAGNVFVADTNNNAVKEMALATAPSLSFASTAVGTTSSDSAKVVKVANNGNQPLNISAVAFAADFPQDGSETTDCAASTSLSSGASCTLSIDFSPQSPGSPLSEQVSLTANALNVSGTQEQISVSGTATLSAQVTANPISANAGVAFSNQVATFTSAGNSSPVSDFIVTINWGDGTTSAGTVTQPGGVGTSYGVSGTHTYAAGGNYTFTVTVTPSGGTAGMDTNTATVSNTPPALLYPAPGSTLKASSETFRWTSAAPRTSYLLKISTLHFGGSDVFGGNTSATSLLVPSIPTNGAPLYVQLSYKVSGAWVAINYSYTEKGTPTPPVMMTPAPNSTLSGSSATFTWSAGAGPTAYALKVGTTHAGASDVYASSTTGTSLSVPSGIPTNGGTLYVTLEYEIGTTWTSINYTYMESGGGTNPPTMVSPAPGSTLTGSNVTFNWNAGTGDTEYRLRIGSTGPGSSDLYLGNPTVSLSETVSGLPTNGLPVYVTIGYKVNGAWHAVGFTYTAQ